MSLLGALCQNGQIAETMTSASIAEAELLSDRLGAPQADIEVKVEEIDCAI